MFHTYITTSCGNKVDIDRASFLMDQELFASATSHASISDCEDVFFDLPDDQESLDKTYPQRVWYWYCEYHNRKYGEPFLPDVKPDWDR